MVGFEPTRAPLRVAFQILPRRHVTLLPSVEHAPHLGDLVRAGRRLCLPVPENGKEQIEEGLTAFPVV